MVGEDFNVVFHGVYETVYHAVQIVGHSGNAATLHCDAKIQVGRDAFMFDYGISRHNPYVSHITQPDQAAIRLGDHQVVDIANVLTKFGSAPHNHIKDLLFFEQLADIDARDENGGGAAHITRLDAMSLSSSEVHFDLERGFLGSGDRKSTRLNSSHSQISYAVFCLKKKK